MNINSTITLSHHNDLNNSSFYFHFYLFICHLGELLDSLNGMHKLMTGENDSFDQAFYNELVTCIAKYDRELMDVVNAQWKGFRTYAENGGNPGVDDWLKCDHYGV